MAVAATSSVLCITCRLSCTCHRLLSGPKTALRNPSTIHWFPRASCDSHCTVPGKQERCSASIVRLSPQLQHKRRTDFLTRHMARDEMNEITEDRWDDEIWGCAEPTTAFPRPKLIFYFGKNDHWVADHTRDQLIAARASNGVESWKPKMYIDQLDIPHSFCIRESPKSLRKEEAYLERP